MTSFPGCQNTTSFPKDICYECEYSLQLIHVNSRQICLQIYQCRHFESCSNLGAPLFMSSVITSESYSAFPISCFPSDEQFGATQKDLCSAAVDGNWALWFWYATWLPSYPFKMAALSASLWHISRNLCGAMPPMPMV